MVVLCNILTGPIRQPQVTNTGMYRLIADMRHETSDDEDGDSFMILYEAGYEYEGKVLCWTRQITYIKDYDADAM